MIRLPIFWNPAWCSCKKSTWQEQQQQRQKFQSFTKLLAGITAPCLLPHSWRKLCLKLKTPEKKGMKLSYVMITMPMLTYNLTKQKGNAQQAREIDIKRLQTFFVLCFSRCPCVALYKVLTSVADEKAGKQNKTREPKKENLGETCKQQKPLSSTPIPTL